MAASCGCDDMQGRTGMGESEIVASHIEVHVHIESMFAVSGGVTEETVVFFGCVNQLGKCVLK